MESIFCEAERRPAKPKSPRYFRLCDRSRREVVSLSVAGHTFGTFAELESAIRDDSECEKCGCIELLANWYPHGTLLGFTLVRRTWCNHLAVDYLAAHPRIASVEKDVNGVGLALLTTVATLAKKINAPTIWLETTAESRLFYQKVFDLPELKDLLIVDRARLNQAVRLQAVRSK